MGAVTYTASRGLLGGVTAGDSVSLDLRLSAAPKSFRAVGAETRALSGRTESVLDRIEETWSVTVAWYPTSQRGDIEQFVKSVMNKESFTLDILGSVAVPDTPLTVEMTSTTVDEIRITPAAWRVSFDVRLVV